jgi:hypothetical protein
MFEGHAPRAIRFAVLGLYVVASSQGCSSSVTDATADANEAARRACGDGVCNGKESCSTCPHDCGACSTGPTCGDGVCSGNETCTTCSIDCTTGCSTGSTPTCGDHTCNGTETCSSCSSDCGQCAPTGSDVTPPIVPTNLSVLAFDVNHVGLTWSASADTGALGIPPSGVHGYNIYRNGQFLRFIDAPRLSASDFAVVAS